jgi:putative FmdB family regulatory protein
MPTYEYACLECGNVQEEIHSMFVTPEIHCQICNSTCERQFSPTKNFVLKGDGWTSNSKIKNDMLNKNKKMKTKMKERTAAGEAVTTLGQLKKKKY